MASRPRAFSVHDPRQARMRTTIALAAGFVTAWALPARCGTAFRAVAGWDVGALVLGGLSWWLILRASPAITRRHASEEDPGRRAAGALVILASGFSMFASAFVLRDARTSTASTRAIVIILSLVAVSAAWLLTHTAYTLRYTHLYYCGGKDEGGLTFPGDEPPGYVEFAYFAFTIGMCFQVSDVAVTSRRIRRTVLGHSMLSFAYNTAILATAVSVVLGVLG